MRKTALFLTDFLAINLIFKSQQLAASQSMIVRVRDQQRSEDCEQDIIRVLRFPC